MQKPKSAKRIKELLLKLFLIMKKIFTILFIASFGLSISIYGQMNIVGFNGPAGASVTYTKDPTILGYDAYESYYSGRYLISKRLEANYWTVEYFSGLYLSGNPFGAHWVIFRSDYNTDLVPPCNARWESIYFAYGAYGAGAYTYTPTGNWKTVTFTPVAGGTSTCNMLPSITPVGVTFAGSSTPPNMYVSVYAPGLVHLETVPYNGGAFVLSAISGAGLYKIVLHQGITPSSVPSFPAGFSSLGDFFGGSDDTIPNGMITFTIYPDNSTFLFHTKPSADKSISFNVFSSAPLPVKLISFEAKVQENQVQLTWATSAETNSAGFEIERSSPLAPGGGISNTKFEKIGFVKSEANIVKSNEKQAYDFVDLNPPLGAGGLYYRLKQVDLDGKFEYSQIKSVKIEGKETVKIFPNPVTDFITIESSNSANINSIELLNAKGSTLYKRIGNENKIDLSQNAPGIYFLKIENKDGKVEVRKVLKN
jgi:hypothetical protein